jgi:hypothetical protein
MLNKERALAVLEAPARAKTKKGVIFLDPYKGKYTGSARPSDLRPGFQGVVIGTPVLVQYFRHEGA